MDSARTKPRGGKGVSCLSKVTLNLSHCTLVKLARSTSHQESTSSNQTRLTLCTISTLPSRIFDIGSGFLTVLGVGITGNLVKAKLDHATWG